MIHTCHTSYSSSYLRVTRMAVVFGVMLGCLPSLQATELFEGMVAYWPLDEGVGDLATDGFGREVGAMGTTVSTPSGAKAMSGFAAPTAAPVPSLKRYVASA